MDAFHFHTIMLLLVVNFGTVVPKDEVSCDFDDDECSWSSESDLPLQWEPDSCFFCSDYYMSLKMSGATTDEAGRLSTPILDGTAIENCKITFEYYIHRNNRCRLSVLVGNMSSEGGTTTITEVWSSQRASDNGDGFEQISNVQIPCSGHYFQVIFEGKKVDSGSCGSPYNEIDVDNIEYSYSVLPTTTTTTTTKQSTTTTTDTTTTITTSTGIAVATTPSVTSTTWSNVTARPQTQQDDDGALTTGGLAAIVVSVIVVVCIFIAVVLFCVVKRRSKGPGGANRWMVKFFKPSTRHESPPSNGAANSTFRLDEQQGPSNSSAHVTTGQGKRQNGAHAYVNTMPSGSATSPLSRTEEGTPRLHNTSPGTSKQPEEDYNHLASLGDQHASSKLGTMSASDTAYDHVPAPRAQVVDDDVADEYAVPHADRKRNFSTASASASHGEDVEKSQDNDYYNLGKSNSPASAVADSSHYLSPKSTLSSSSPSEHTVYNVLNANGAQTAASRPEDTGLNQYDHCPPALDTGGEEYSHLRAEDDARERQRRLAEVDYDHMAGRV